VTNSLSYFMGCICKKYRGIVLAHLFIRVLLVLMCVAVLESVFRKYWLPWCLMVIECFV